MAAAREGLALAIALHGPGSVSAATRRGSLAAALGSHEGASAAIPEYREAMRVLEGTFGPNHINVARFRMQLAIAEQSIGAVADAALDADAALAGAAVALGDSPELWSFHMTVCDVRRRLHDWAAASAACARSRALAERRYGDPSIAVALAEYRTASLLRERGELAAARSHAQAAIDRYAAIDASRSSNAAAALSTLGTIQRELGELDAAAASLRAAHDILRTLYGETHPEVTYPLFTLARIDLARGRRREARTALEGVLRLRRAGLPAGDESIAVAAFTLAKLLSRSERQRARGLAEEARAILAALGAGHDQDLAEITAWQASHPAPPGVGR